jgi:hypothetical protein
MDTLISIALIALLLWAFGYICHARGKIVGIGIGRESERDYNTQRNIRGAHTSAPWIAGKN